MKFYFPRRGFKFCFEPSIEYAISVTSINYADEEDPDGATATITKVINNRDHSLIGEVQSVFS